MVLFSLFSVYSYNSVVSGRPYIPTSSRQSYLKKYCSYLTLICYLWLIIIILVIIYFFIVMLSHSSWQVTGVAVDWSLIIHLLESLQQSPYHIWQARHDWPLKPPMTTPINRSSSDVPLYQNSAQITMCKCCTSVLENIQLSQRDMFNECWFIVGPASTTLAQQ